MPRPVRARSSTPGGSMTQYQTEKMRTFDTAMSTTSTSKVDTSRAENPISVADSATTFRIKPRVRIPFVSTMVRNSRALRLSSHKPMHAVMSAPRKAIQPIQILSRANDGTYCSSRPNEMEKKISACARTTTSRTATTTSRDAERA